LHCRYPIALPPIALLEAFHRDKKAAVKRMRQFYISYIVIPWKWDWLWKKEAVQMSDEEVEKIDPHHRLMKVYKEVPEGLFGAIWIIWVALGLSVIYMAITTPPWWGFFIACLVSCKW
jgi:hypothetical protein